MKKSTIEVYELKANGRAMLMTWDDKDPQHVIMLADATAAQQWRPTGIRMESVGDNPITAAALVLVSKGNEERYVEDFQLRLRRDLGAWVRQCEDEHRSVLYRTATSVG